MQQQYVGYMRVSTASQEDNGYGLDVQEQGIRGYAARHGLALLEQFIWDDISGDMPEREGLNKVKALAKTKAIAGVIIYRPDRLARKSWIGMQALEELHGWGVEVHFDNLGIIPNTPEGRFQAAIHFSVGELDKAQMLKKLNGAIKAKISTHGLPLNSGRYSYGYRFIGSKKSSAWEIYEPEAEVIRAIFRMHREGTTIGAILKWLNDNKFPTAEDRRKTSGKQRDYGQWAVSQVYKILKNPIYKGKIPYYRYATVTRKDGSTYQKAKPLDDPSIVWVDGPAIVSPDDWEKSQQIITANRKHPIHDIHNRYLLSGMLKCGLCGYGVSGRRWSDPRKPHLKPIYYYNCNAHWGNRLGRNAVHICSLPPFRADLVEQAVWEYIETKILDPESLDTGLQELSSHTERERAALEERRARDISRIEEVQAKKERLISLYLSGIYSQEELATHKKQLEELLAQYKAGLEELERQIARLGASEQDIATIKEFASVIRQGLDLTKWEHKRYILEHIGLEVELALEDDQRVVNVTTHLNPDQARLQIIQSRQSSKKGAATVASTEEDLYPNSTSSP